MATLVNRLNRAFQVLMGAEGRTTQMGVDPEFVDNTIADIITIDNGRSSKYKDYIWMDDNYGQEISSSLDSVADSVIRVDEPLDEVINIKTEHAPTYNFISDLYRYLDIRSNLWSYARSLAKFGDLFVEIIWSKDGRNNKLSNIVGLKVLPASTMYLNVKDGIIDKELPYRQEVEGTIIAKFRPWQIIHFMLPREPTDDFGTSWLKSARLPYRQLLAMENALVIARMKKTNVRVHMVDITGKTGDQAVDFINNYKTQFKTKLWTNPTTGKIERHKNPLMSDDDIYMGVTKDGGKYAGIQLVEGKSEIDIKDILYVREKMLSALKVPKYRINIDNVGSSNKLVSVDQALYFSAAVQRVQLALIKGLSYLTDLGLIVKGIDIASRKKDYTITLPKQRTTDELIAARVQLIKSTVAKNYKELGILSDEDIMRDVLNFSPDAIAKTQKAISKNAPASPNDNTTNKNFNKTGTGSAPVRKPQKEELEQILADDTVSEALKDVAELMRNRVIFKNKDFEDINTIKKALNKEL